MNRSAFLASIFILTAASIGFTQTNLLPTSPAGGSLESLPIDIQADRLEYRDNNKTLRAIGHVVITHGNDLLKSDDMTIDTETYDITGTGNVYIEHEGRIYEGDEFQYNLQTRQGDFGTFEIHDPPFFVTAESSQRLNADEFLIHNARVSTCEGDDPELFIRSRESRVIKGKEIRSKHVFFYLGGIPVFYLPYVKHDVSGEKTNIDVVPGYSDRMGAFLLTAYNYRLNEWVRAASHLDYRHRRGWGIGQDVFWRDEGTETYEGQFRAYYLDDDMPFEDAQDEAETGTLVDSDRYRLQLRHRHSIQENDTLRIRSDYLSDPDVLEDFFDREFRNNTQPENFATWTHRDPRYTANLTVNTRLNDFYSNINRIPEFSFLVPRIQLADSSFYYTSENSASYLESSFADQLNLEDFDAGRIDSAHTLSHNSRHFGFLNLIPRVGFSGTYFSKTIENRLVVEQVTTTNELGDVTFTEGARTESVDGDSDLRAMIEFGFDASFKAFKVIDNKARGEDLGRRHVIEPFLGYTWIPEPNLEPPDLFQFDRIDQRDESNDLLLGVRNKWQTKRRGQLHDLLDVNVFTIYNVEKVNGETEDIPFVFFDGEVRWIDGFWVDVDGSYNVDEGDVESFNAQLALRRDDLASVSMEYRYNRVSRDLFAGRLNFFPRGRWSYEGYARYDFDTSHLEEHSHFVVRKSDCLGVGAGIKQVDGDVTLWAQIWLQAFPRAIAELGR